MNDLQTTGHPMIIFETVGHPRKTGGQCTKTT